jgi:hypothetical protein
MKISDIAINDTIITKDNIKGTVIQINSILYLNNIMSKKKNLPNYKLVLDSERSKDKIYNTITLLVMDEEPYFLSIDLADIKEIIKYKKNTTIFDKLKNIFK